MRKDNRCFDSTVSTEILWLTATFDSITFYGYNRKEEVLKIIKSDIHTLVYSAIIIRPSWVAKKIYLENKKNDELNLSWSFYYSVFKELFLDQEEPEFLNIVCWLKEKTDVHIDDDHFLPVFILNEGEKIEGSPIATRYPMHFHYSVMASYLLFKLVKKINDVDSQIEQLELQQEIKLNINEDLTNVTEDTIKNEKKQSLLNQNSNKKSINYFYYVIPTTIIVVIFLLCFKK